MSKIFIRKSIQETWKRLEGLCLYDHYFLCLLASISRPSIFLFLQTLYQVLFTQMYSVRVPTIYLLFSYQDIFVNQLTFCHSNAHQNILLKSIFKHRLAMAMFLHFSCSFWCAPSLPHNTGQYVFICCL